MVGINLYGLSLFEAEEAICEIWSCLEEYNIPSPVMSLDDRADGTVAIGFVFDEPMWTELVRLRLSGWMGSATPDGNSTALLAGGIGGAARAMHAPTTELSFVPGIEEMPLRAAGSAGAVLASRRSKRR